MSAGDRGQVVPQDWDHQTDPKGPRSTLLYRLDCSRLTITFTPKNLVYPASGHLDPSSRRREPDKLPRLLGRLFQQPRRRHHAL
jgi:hypothetical protein